MAEAQAVTSVARLIDISAVQAHHARDDVHELARVARQAGFFSAHVLPHWLPLLRELLGADGTTLAGAPVGFPSGGSTTAIKVAEAEALVRDGVEEIDVVMNIGRVRSGHLGHALADLRAVVDAVPADLPVKAVIETALLDPDDIRRCCQLAVEANAQFVKTGTGWAGAPTSIETVRLISESVGDAIEIKAAGGIRDLATVTKMRTLGVSRFGINTAAALAILEEERRA